VYVIPFIGGFSGMQVVFGKSIMGFKTDGDFFGILLLLVPAALFCLIQFSDKMAFVKDKLHLFAMILCGVGVLAPIIVSMTFAEGLSSPGFGFFLSILLYLAGGFLAFLGFQASKK
jgi:hypothetical protein